MWQQDDTLQAFGENDTLRALEQLWLIEEDRPSSSLRQFPSGVPGGTYLPNDIGDDFQTIQDPLGNVDAAAVRKFLRSAQLEQDIVEAIMSQGGLKGDSEDFPFSSFLRWETSQRKNGVLFLRK